MITNRHFGKSLKKYVDERDINAGKIAKKIGITHNGFTDYYKSENPRLRTKAKILDALGISEEELFENNCQNNEVNSTLDSMVVMPKKEYESIMKAKERELQTLKENNELLRENNQLRSELMKFQNKKIEHLEEKVL